MRLHLPALPHLDPVPESDFCAYTAKVRRFPTMLSMQGIESIVYSGLRGKGKVRVVSGHDRKRWFGSKTWDSQNVFNAWEPTDTHWSEFNADVIAAIEKRFRPGDMIGIIVGSAQEPIAAAFKDRAPIVEWGVGYQGVIPYSFRAFESQAQLHMVAGRYGDTIGRGFDTVIPNAFDPDEYTLGEKGDYLLFLGRQIPTKGTEIVKLLAERGHRIVTAGQLDGNDPIPGTEYVGVVTGKQKRELLAGARALLAPTLYREPFGGVVVESLLSGTPAITTPFGAFTETIRPEVNGFHAFTPSEFERAIGGLANLNTELTIRLDAISRYGLQAVSAQYGRWLAQVDSLTRAGWSNL